MTAADLTTSAVVRVRDVWVDLCSRDPALTDNPPPLADEVIDALRAALAKPQVPGVELDAEFECLASSMVARAATVDAALTQLAYLSTAFEQIVPPDLPLSRRPWANSQLNTLIQRFMIAVVRAGAAGQNVPKRQPAGLSEPTPLHASRRGS